MTTSRNIAARLIPVLLVQSVVWHGVRDRSDPEHAAVLAQLAQALDEEVAGLTLHQAETAKRHAMRAARAIEAPAIAANMACAKFGLIVFYALRTLIDDGRYHLRPGAFSDAMDAVLNPDGTVTELANITALDASAQKHGRRMVRDLEALGYFLRPGAALSGGIGSQTHAPTATGAAL